MREEIGQGLFLVADADSTLKKIVLSHEELTLLLGGIDLESVFIIAVPS